MFSSRLAALGAALLTYFAAPLAGADVLTVDKGDPLADFQQIQAAIDSALEDDLILVRATPSEFLATYEPFVIDGKSLTVLMASNVRIRKGGSAIRGLAADQAVTLRRFQVELLESESGCVLSEAFLSVEDNLGPVWLEGFIILQGQLAGDCTDIFGGDDLLEVHAPEVRVANSAAVYMNSVAIRRYGSITATQPPVLEIENSDVVLIDAEIRGGACLLPGGQGAVAVELTDSRVGLWDTVVSGGIGGVSTPDGSVLGGNGGTALSLAGEGSSAVVELGAMGTALLNGGGPGGGSFPGVAGEPFLSQASAPAPQFVEHRPLSLITQIGGGSPPGPWYEPGTFEWLRILNAPASAPAFLFVGTGPNPLPLQLAPGLTEPIGIDPLDNFLIVLDPTDEDGFTQFRVTDEFDGLLDPLSFIVQGVVIDAENAEVQLTNSTFLTVF